MKITRDRNEIASWLAVTSGILLFISGTNGYAIWKSIESRVIEIFNNNPLLNLVFLVLLFIASLGGISVFFGAYLIYKKKILIGRFMIMLGSGVGIISMIIKIYLIISTKEVFFDLFSSLASIGIILALAAQLTAKKY